MKLGPCRRVLIDIDTIFRSYTSQLVVTSTTHSDGEEPPCGRGLVSACAYRHDSHTGYAYN